MPDSLGQRAGAAAKLVLVTGSGRSGTSTVAGALKRLGLTIPQPENEPDEKNPRGYYEPAWATHFDKRLLKQVGVHNNDSRPDAVGRADTVARAPENEQTLREWLQGQLGASQIVVKDPHVLWLSDLWVESALAVGLTPSFVTMLRHPAEVVGSRDLAYLSSRSEDLRRLRETANVAGWVNIMLVTEKSSRPHPRAFVRYTDLIEDWRSALAVAAAHLDLTLNADLTQHHPHEVDDFIDVDLRRSRVTWDDIDVPDHLRDIAESVWRALETLIDKPHDAATLARLDELRDEYQRAHAHAVGFAHYDTEAQVAAARRETRERLSTRHQQELNRLRRRLRRSTADSGGPGTQARPSAGGSAPRDRGRSARLVHQARRGAAELSRRLLRRR